MHRFMAHLGDLAGLDMVMARRDKVLRATAGRVGRATPLTPADRAASQPSSERDTAEVSTRPAAGLRA